MKTIINTTPHEIVFRKDDGSEFTVERSEYTLNARAEERIAREENGALFVETIFVPTDEGWRMIKDIRQKHGADCIIVGSIIAAQAYAPEVVAMTPAVGFERVPLTEKRMNPHKFTVYSAPTTISSSVKNEIVKNLDELESIVIAEWGSSIGFRSDSLVEKIKTLVMEAKEGWGYAGSPYENSEVLEALNAERLAIVEGLRKILQVAEYADNHIKVLYLDPAIKEFVQRVPWLAPAIVNTKP